MEEAPKKVRIFWHIAEYVSFFLRNSVKNFAKSKNSIATNKKM
jgi:hypothetical protein